MLPAGWAEADRQRAGYLIRAGVVDGPLGAPVTEAGLERLLFRLGERLGVLSVFEARFSQLEKEAIWVERDGKVERYALPKQLPAFRRRDGEPVAGELSLLAGDRLGLVLAGGELAAVVQPLAPESTALEPVAAPVSWSRLKTKAELSAQVEQRYPGLGFEGFEVLSRGRSGRVGKIRLLGKGGRTQLVEGLAVRWLLDVPETLFSAREVRTSKGLSGWQFTGKGWGHGVGLCQTGAFGMAGRGLTYRDILQHYYSGTELARLRR
jgi:stage II sporulation protein D